MVKTFEEHVMLIKNYCNDYIARCGDINNITAHDVEYNKIKNLYICDNSGRRLTMQEKFNLVGISYKAKRNSQDDNISMLQKLIKEFTRNGGDVKNLKSSDKLYHKIKDTQIIIDGKILSLEEKFTLVGYNRLRKYKNYGEINKILDNLSFFEDSDGFVDSYRKNSKAEYYVKQCSAVYNLPESLIVALLADKKLKKYYLNVNRIDYIKTELGEYLKTYGTFVGIKSNNPTLYEQLSSLKKSYPTKDGIMISMAELFSELGFDSFENRFLNYSNTQQFNEQQFFLQYRDIFVANNNTISISNIESSDYTKLTGFLRRCNISLEDYFAKFGVTYLYPKNVSRNNLVSTCNYPFLEEMKQERDNMISDYFNQFPQMKFTGPASLFTIRLKICQEVYKKYKNKIIEKFCNSQSMAYNKKERIE